ncbi:MAG TPA: twin-arginine translocation signal domain-containing protein [Gemmataceae bacterium]
MPEQTPPPSTRREFLHAAAVTTAAASAGPYFLGAADKSGGKRPVVGEGEHTYECVHNWGLESLPDGHHYGGASHGVAVDSQGLIYITHHGDPGSIFVFEPSGKFVRAMGESDRVAAKRAAGRGHGIDIRKEGGEEFIYLSPNESSLAFAKITLKGETVWRKDRAALHKDSGVYETPKVVFRPTNASFRPDGGYYLGDGYGSHYLFEYDRNDRFVRTIGGPGSADGKFSTPHGQWLDDRDGTPKLVVADRANKRLQWFDMQGKHLRTLGGFLFPADIDTRGEVMVVPDLHARVTLLDADNKVITHLGDDEAWRAQVLDPKVGMRNKPNLWRPGRFVHPHDACFDADGNIYVTEWVNTGRVTKLVKVG